MMRVAVLRDPQQLSIEERPMPRVAPGWVLLSVDATGICGTDVAVYEGRHPADFPVVMGHEFSGHVLAIGDGVTDFSVGQPVMAEGSWRDLVAFPGTAAVSGALGRTADGCFAEAVAVPADIVHHLYPGVDPVTAQSVTTLATAIHAANRAGDLSGSRVAIIGPGHAGLLLLQVVLNSHASHVTVFGTRHERLEIALELGASAVVNVKKSSPQADHSEPFDIVFEASGKAAGLATAFTLARSQGTIICYGIISEHLTPVWGYNLYAKELNVLGSRGAGGQYESAIQLLSSGSVQIAPLVSHVLPLTSTVDAIDLITNRRESALRIVLVPGSDAN